MFLKKGWIQSTGRLAGRPQRRAQRLGRFILREATKNMFVIMSWARGLPTDGGMGLRLRVSSEVSRPYPYTFWIFFKILSPITEAGESTIFSPHPPWPNVARAWKWIYYQTGSYPSDHKSCGRNSRSNQFRACIKRASSRQSLGRIQVLIRAKNLDPGRNMPGRTWKDLFIHALRKLIRTN